jgi:hypothetical protein
VIGKEKPAYGVDLVDEHDAGRVLLALLKGSLARRTPGGVPASPIQPSPTACAKIKNFARNL